MSRLPHDGTDRSPAARAPGPVADLISRYAQVAVILNDSYGNLFGVSRSTPYPTRELARAVAAVPGFAA